MSIPPRLLRNPRPWPAFALLLSACLVLSAGLLGAQNGGDEIPAALVLLAFALALGLYGIVAHRPGPSSPSRPASPVPSRYPTWQAAVLALALAAHLLLILYFLTRTHFPWTSRDLIDTYTFQQEAVHRLLHGIDPYGQTQANIYSAAVSTHYYGPGMVANGRVLVGFPYLPLTLLFALPGYLLGDIRYGYIAAILLTAVLLFRLLPGWRGLLLALFLLLNPVTFFIEDRSWTEPIVLLFLVATAYTGMHRPRLLPLALGLLLASKQYSLPLLPLAIALAQPRRFHSIFKLLATSLAVAAATLLPFLIAGPRTLWHDLVLFLGAGPLRADAISFARNTPSLLIAWPILLLFFLLWAVFRLRDPRLFAAAYGFALLLFFSFSKQAFCNYYFMAGQALFLSAIQLTAARSPEPQPLA